MKRTEKEQYLKKATVGYCSILGGLEVKDIIYGIDDAVVFVAGAWTSDRSVHTAKIHYETERAYFNFNGVRVHFDEILRA